MDAYFGIDGELDPKSPLVFTGGTNSDIIIALHYDPDSRNSTCFITGRRMQLVVTCNRSYRLISSELLSIYDKKQEGLISDNIPSSINKTMIQLVALMSREELNLDAYKKHYDIVNRWFTSIYTAITVFT